MTPSSTLVLQIARDRCNQKEECKILPGDDEEESSPCKKYPTMNLHIWCILQQCGLRGDKLYSDTFALILLDTSCFRNGVGKAWVQYSCDEVQPSKSILPKNCFSNGYMIWPKNIKKNIFFRLCKMKFLTTTSLFESKTLSRVALQTLDKLTDCF